MKISMVLVAGLGLVVPACYTSTPVTSSDPADRPEAEGTSEDPGRPPDDVGPDDSVPDGGEPDPGDAPEPRPEPDGGVDPGSCSTLAVEVDWDCDDANVYIAPEGLPAGETPLLHMIGIYEGDSAHGGGSHPTGPCVVHVEPTLAPVYLALTAYEPVEWRIDAAPGAVIEGVVVYGYYDQLVTANVEEADRIA